MTAYYLCIYTNYLKEEHLAGVDRIINSASALEDPHEVKHEQEMKEEIMKKNYDPDRVFENSKY